MIWFLRILFTLVLASMLWVTSWASLQVSLFQIPREVWTHPWFIATLFDAYWGFITFFVWLAYKEISWAPRLLWLIAILLLGNIAMSIYVLIQLFRAPATASIEQVVRNDGRGTAWWQPVALIGALAAIAALV
jgi:hypothetical protein